MQTLVAEILAAWRRADRLAATLPVGSVEQAAAQDAHDRLRDLYHELTRSGAAKGVTVADARTLLAELEPDGG